MEVGSTEMTCEQADKTGWGDGTKYGKQKNGAKRKNVEWKQKKKTDSGVQEMRVEENSSSNKNGTKNEQPNEWIYEKSKKMWK